MSALFSAQNPRLLALVVLAGSLGLLGGALAFEHLGGYAPCGLCLPQRGPHAAIIVIAAWAAICAPFTPAAARGMLGVAGLLLLVSFTLALHHAGVEQHWWAGPAACSGGTLALPDNVTDLAASLKASHIVRCDQAAWEMFGLSLAGYNALFSAVLAGLCFLPFARPRQKDPLP